MIKCQCMICNYEWEFKDGEQVRTDTPCGHEGMFSSEEVA